MLRPVARIDCDEAGLDGERLAGQGISRAAPGQIGGGRRLNGGPDGKDASLRRFRPFFLS
jgi:hypothetical protein